MGTTGQSITLANSIIGVGILAMPFCFQQCGVLLATLILLFMGLVSRICCYFLLKSALIARRRNFELLAFHVFGPAGKLAVEIGIIGFLMGTCIAYFVVVGDLGPQIIAKMFNINQSDILRTSIMVIVSLVCVLPLGLLRNVDSLSNVSAATIGFYFCLVMKVITETASQLWVSDWQPKVEMWKPSGVLQCVPIFSMALFCQTQLFEIFESLPSLSLEKMNLVTKNAINICTGVYFTLGLFGYMAFASQDISGNILMSLSPTMANDVIKLGFVMSVAFSFPLIIFPCRASLYSLLYKKVHSPQHEGKPSIPTRWFRGLTVAIVAVALAVSLLLPNIELVLGLLGSTIGVIVCLVFPAACFVHLTFKDTNERLLAKGCIILGLIIMVLGTYANLQAAENQIDKYDDKYITQERIDKMVEEFFNNKEKTNGAAAKLEIKAGQYGDANNNGENIIKESVALPPNPVPPESQSNEKVQNNDGIKKIKEDIPKPKYDVLDKVSETHPKNLNRINEANMSNGVNKKESPKEDLKPQQNEEKLNMIKQQQLIETIKQHGEEQKELIKEQKEILTEIKKTKEELQKNKNEAAEADAKKLAVESIKKIANKALQSLAGVSEKPGKVVDEKKSEQLEKLADEAVQEIAQKAVETIEAIKAIKENPDQFAPKLNVPNVPLVPVKQYEPNSIQTNAQANQRVQNNIPQDVQNVPENGQNYDNKNVQSQNTNVQTNQNFGKVAQPQNVFESPGNVAQAAVNGVESPKAGPLNSNVAQLSGIAKSQSNVPKPLANMQPGDVAQPVGNVAQPVGNLAQSVGNVAQPVVNVAQTSSNAAQSPDNLAQSLVKSSQHSSNVAQPPQRGAQPLANVLQQANNQPQANLVQPSANKQETNVQSVDAQVPNANGANIQTLLNNEPKQNRNIAQNLVNNIVYNQPILNNQQQPAQNDLKIIQTNEHSHSLDEPKSYQRGEEEQKDTETAKNIAQNVPLPLAMNGIKSNPQKNVPESSILNNEGDNVENVQARQKREVVDCTEKSKLKNEDKEICNTLVNNQNDDAEINKILPQVDLSQALPKDLPMYQNAIHHISRSLKMLHDSENKR